MASLASFSQGSNNPGDPLSTQPPKIKDNYIISGFFPGASVWQVVNLDLMAILQKTIFQFPT